MRVKTDQTSGFAEQFITIPDSDLDTLDHLLDWETLAEYVESNKGDYSALSLFKMFTATNLVQHVR